jgi:hypothetical protein
MSAWPPAPGRSVTTKWGIEGGRARLAEATKWLACDPPQERGLLALWLRAALPLQVCSTLPPGLQGLPWDSSPAPQPAWLLAGRPATPMAGCWMRQGQGFAHRTAISVSQTQTAAISVSQTAAKI